MGFFMEKKMKIKIVLLITSMLIQPAWGHSGRTDSSGGHNCSYKSQQKGLCYGYHYHNTGNSINSNMAIWTGGSKLLHNSNGVPLYSCEFNLNGRIFWKTYTRCPSSIKM